MDTLFLTVQDLCTSCVGVMLATALAVVVVVGIIARIFLKSPDAPEGMKLPPVWSTGLPLVGTFAAFASDPLGTVRRARKECGNVFTMKLVSEDCTFLIGSEAHAHFFSASDEQLDQADVYKFMTPIFGKGVVYDATLERRRQQMRALGAALRPADLRRYPAVIAKETKTYLADKWGDSGEVDLLPSMAELIILTASATLLGPEVRNELFLEVSHLYELLDKGLTPLSIFFPNAPTPAHSKRDYARKEISKLFGGIVQRRKADPLGSAKNTDMLQRLMEFKFKDGSMMSDDELSGMMICALFAGQHTSSITTTFTALLLLDSAKKGADHLDRVMEELTEVEDYPGAFANGEIDFTHIAKEDVLHSSIKEAIRMYPPLIFLMRRVMKPMSMPNGTYVPKGHRVIVSNAVAQMLPEIFPNPETYDPSRWTDFDIASFPKYSFVGFGAGIHTCMGESFAFMQIRTILSVLLSTYELEYLKETAPEPDYTAMVVPPKGPNMIRYKRRVYVNDGSAKKKAAATKKNAAKAKPEESLAIDAADSTILTMDEVKKHCTKDDLWLIVKGRVYDVTNYVHLHQGGEAALEKFAGKEATDAVYGPQHPGTVPTLLEKYFVGTLEK